MADSGDTSIGKDKKPMTDEERIKLAEKLDNDLEDFISGLEKRSYNEGWPEDKWQEEMEKHPFFMTKSPEPGEELSPLMQGLQDLKYDTTENTPEELALTYKEDGNFNYKCKKYRLAIISYSEGLKQKCSSDEINAQLYNNRSAAHFFLKNYRSSLNDCLLALKLKPDYVKTISRAAQCYFHLKEYKNCIEYCDIVLRQDPKNDIINLRKDASSKKLIAERDNRKKKFHEIKFKESEKELINAIKERGIKILSHEDDNLELSMIEPGFPEVLNSKVHLDNGRLIWPVIFLYPEYKMSEFIQEFHEDSCFIDHLIEMFSNTPSWDIQQKYKPEDIVIYYEDIDGKSHKVSKEKTLGDILSRDSFRVDRGTPAFIILVKKTPAEEAFLNNS